MVSTSTTPPDLGDPPSRVLWLREQAQVATAMVVQLGADPARCVEVVDGLDPPHDRAHKWIINVSTQVGCPVGCPYCDAGGGFRGNLSAREILSQIELVLDRHPGQAQRCAKLKVHFARMGEPALNDAVLVVLQALPALVRSPGLWACVASVTPRGREAWFEQLLEIRNRLFSGRFQLQLSRNTSDDQARQRLIPYPHLSDAEVAVLGERFAGPGQRKPVLNYALARDVPFEVEAIARVFDPTCFAIKLTPLNPTARGRQNGLSTLLRSERGARVEDAIAELRAHGYDVVVSVGDAREDEVGSNCGQAVRWLASAGRSNA